MKTELSFAKQPFLLWVPPFLSYELWKLRIELWKLPIQTAPKVSLSYIYYLNVNFENLISFRLDIFIHNFISQKFKILTFIYLMT